MQARSRIALCSDPYGRWELGHQEGVIIRRAGESCWILWDGNDVPERWSEGDIRYKVDTGRARITGPEKRDPLKPLG